jgi:hypothetical protein
MLIRQTTFLQQMSIRQALYQSAHHPLVTARQVTMLAGVLHAALP